MKTDTQENIVSYIKQRGEASPKELVDHFELTPESIFRHLKILSDRNVIFKVGSRPKVLYMIARPEKKKKNIDDDPIEVVKSGAARVMNFCSIPIFGAADCGPAKQIAEHRPEGFLRISKRLLRTDKKNIFAIQAIGNSMNAARVNKERSIEDGDYVLVDGSYKTPQTGDYVLSVIDGVANIKKFYEDKKNRQVVLLSESKNFYPPIYIHPSECEYLVNGKVIDVIKKVKMY